MLELWNARRGECEALGSLSAWTSRTERSDRRRSPAEQWTMGYMVQRAKSSNKQVAIGDNVHCATRSQ